MKGRATAGGKVGKARRRSTQGRRPSYADLQKQLSEALEQQTATSEVLQVISSSPGDLAPVFNSILVNARRICEAKFAHLMLYDGELFHPAAMEGAPPAFAEFWRGPKALDPRTGPGRAVATKQIVHIPDLHETEGYKNREPQFVAMAELTGARAVLIVPMLKDDRVIGTFSTYRQEARPFADKQIELISNFARQAVIAIENTRLLNELRQRTDDLTESLEQQTATSEVLRVISSSPGDLQPVFNAMLENATRICEAKFGTLFRFDGGKFHLVASMNTPPKMLEVQKKRGPFLPPSGSAFDRMFRDKQVSHTIDAAAYSVHTVASQYGGARSTVAVPMLKDNELVGAIVMYRQEVRPFTDKQIELVQNFAAQAVIAIENTRLLNELRQRTGDLTESLEQQTATSEVLKVISSSPGELKPVFDAMLKNATHICGAKYGILHLYDASRFHPVATLGAPPALLELHRQTPSVQPRPGTNLHRIIRSKEVVHILDDAESPSPGAPARVADARTTLTVPMLKDNDLIGAFSIYRQEVRPFSDKQIDLVKNFAAQAVIAIENTRLLSELRESLEQQTATAEVLKVISSSPGELKPVFQAMLENATRICEAKFGNLFLREGGESPQFRAVAVHGERDYLETWRREPLLVVDDPRMPMARFVKTREVLHVRDLTADESYVQRIPRIVSLVEGARARTFVIVPMLKDKELVGSIALYRQEVRPFTNKQIELVQNFAAQAVIAIENTRLLNELRESLQQQTATSDVLSVISSSPGELVPVFNAMLENALRICDAKFGMLFQRYSGNSFVVQVMVGAPPELVDVLLHKPMTPRPGVPLDRVMRTKKLVHTVDAAAEQTKPLSAQLAGARSHITVPMLKDNEVAGAISIYRREVKPFTDKQIELLTNFAAQAVIAIENTRLLNELRQRTDDLSESLQQQTATSEVLQVISSSTGELKPVFNAVLENAIHLCEAKFGVLYRYDGNLFHPEALVGASQALIEFHQKRGAFQAVPGTPLHQLWQTRDVVHTADDAGGPSSSARLGGARSHLAVPMFKEAALVGSIIIYRQEVRPFTDKQIALVQNFAAQAVIAIENTRLLNELRQRTDDLTESLEQQTATSEVLKVISSSPGDLEPVFQAMLENATRICEANYGVLFRYYDGTFQPAAMHNVPNAHADFLVRRGAFQAPTGTPLDRLLKTNRLVQTADDAAEPMPGSPSRFGGARSLVAVPMHKESALVGAFVIYRQEVRPFTDKQIALMQNFASQAVIAIENTRLLSELRESLQQQTATAEVLKVISRSTFDLQAVLDTLVQSAARLCEADMASINQQAGNHYRQVASFGYSPEFIEFMKEHPIPAGRGSAVGRTVAEGRIVQINDVLADPEFAFRGAQIGGIRTILGVPLLREGTPVGVITLQRKTVRPFTDKQIALVQTFADQAVIAIENVRLFDEIQDKSHQLAEASQHKSQFLANMSHELRTPLNAILGYNELIVDGIYGTPSEKMQAVLKRIESNGRHLLGLINAVLDLSKIEAGQFTLDLADYSLQNVAQTVYNAVEPLALDKKLAFKADVQSELPLGRGDERRLTQVLLNLVGNAIKFTDAGEVVIKADASNGTFNLAVRDTGPGISAADQAKLFQEFQQADNSNTRKKEGTGLGLAISKRIIEMHGGRIWMESQLGKGSTFFVMIPVQAQEKTKPPSK